MHVASGTFPGLRRAAWFITGRHGGFSDAPFDACNLALHVGDDPAAVLRNRALVQTDIGASSVAWMVAEHGDAVLRIDAVASPELAPADVLVTSQSGVGLAALAADCVPLALANPHGVSVAHVGWRGLVAGTVDAAVGAMAALGPGDIEVVVGPAVCAACYPVPEERCAQVRRACGGAVADAALPRSGHLDVRAGVLAQLRALPSDAGQIGSIAVHGGCTAEDPGSYSYRRDGRTGRHAMIVVMRDE